jgi:hypothetical protein
MNPNAILRILMFTTVITIFQKNTILSHAVCPGTTTTTTNTAQSAQTTVTSTSTTITTTSTPSTITTTS